MKFIEEHCVLLVVLAKVHPETRGEAVKRKSGKVKERYGKALLQVLEELISHKSHIEMSLGHLIKDIEAERDAAVADLSN